MEIWSACKGVILPLTEQHLPLSCLLEQATLNGPVHKGENHVPKSDSDHDPLPDWVCDLNYVRSQALQPPSRSRTGSAHCKVIFCFYCAD